MTYDYDVIVIGAGSAGLVTASASLTLGAKVAIIEEHKMGGDCLNTGCVPSKALLKSAHLSAELKRGHIFGIDADFKLDFEAVKAHIQQSILTIAPHDSIERFEKMGATVIVSRGVLIDAHTVETSHGTISGRNIVIATGSRPSIPPIKGLSDVKYYTNETIFAIEERPKRLIVLGAGAIGLELGQAFRHLGSEVIMIDRAETIFSKDDAQVAPLMTNILQDEGIDFRLNAQIEAVRSVKEQIVVTVKIDGAVHDIMGDALLVSLGRVPNTERMGLDAAGVKLDRYGHIVVDSKLQSSVSSVYACGDVVGPYLFTHMAGYQGGVVTRNMLFPFHQKVNYQAVPWTTYTKPAVAHVGALETDLKRSGRRFQCVTVDLADNDRAITDGHAVGFLKLLLDGKSRVIGATVVAERAADLILPASIAVNNRLKLAQLTRGIIAYPSEGEIYYRAANQFRKARFKPWMKRVLQKILFRH